MQQTFFSGDKGRFARSLSVQVSLLLILAALLPLIITITSSELLSRPQLIAKANASMKADAQTHILAIENYFSQPIIDVRSLSQDDSLAAYLQGNSQAANAAMRVLAAGYQRNMNYIGWSLIDAKGAQRLSYPAPLPPHGRYFIPPETITRLLATNNAEISSDYYNPQGNMLTVDITETVIAIGAKTTQTLGYLRATLNSNFIWDMIQNESGMNGTGSYAFIADENGVIVAHPDVTKNFTAIAPFTPGQQADIATLERYGKNTRIPAWPMSALSDKINQQAPFGLTVQQQRVSYQVIGMPVFVVPWTYFVLSPISVVTALANQQLLTIGSIGVIVLLLAAILGIIVGQQITSPVLRSVTQLKASSKRLKDLASQEEFAITQQTWVVDSSKTGLSSVNYYIDTSQNATNYIAVVGKGLENHWPSMEPEERQRALHNITIAANHIYASLQQQKKNGRKLSATLDLTQQVTDQLKTSTEAATAAAAQMEQVVSQLQQVVGKPDTTPGKPQ
jgi:hypothetical protein